LDGRVPENPGTDFTTAPEGAPKTLNGTIATEMQASHNIRNPAIVAAAEAQHQNTTKSRKDDRL